MKLDGPPAWKMKKFTVEEMQSIFGTLEGKVRYAVLKLTKDLTVRYTDGEFKISGTYGKP
ncbi:hypothetical protein BC629DRAFT_1576038 [Irpex lacteus]|nr:hypothetical protein BC629DRAFT_1576038 [Irpex lacteus]